MAATVLLVDDHAGFRAQARVLLTTAGLDVVAEAKDAAGALTAARAFRPRVILLDIQLPDGSGFEVAQAILEGDDPPVVILISSREASDYGTRIGRSGGPRVHLQGRAVAAAIRALLSEVR